jgi:enolase
MTEVIRVSGREILDSRGNPTVEDDVYLREAVLGEPLCLPGRRPVKTKP